MRRIYTLIVILAVWLATLIAPPPLATSRAAVPSSDYAPGEVIVKFKAHTFDAINTEQTDQLLARARSTLTGRAPAADYGIEALAPKPRTSRLARIIKERGLDRTFVLKFSEGDVMSVVQALKDDPNIEYAEPNYRVITGTVIPNDPEFRRQWALMNLGVGVEGQPATRDSDIKATEAWAITTGSPDVLVAVTDTGVDIHHPDLAPNIYVNPNEIPNNNVDDDGNGYVDDVTGYNVAGRNSDISDIAGHGTQMSGIIAARSNNEIGISGVSQSKILPVKFFKRTGSGQTDVTATVADAARALVYAVAAGAQIINASWRVFLNSGGSEAEAQALSDAVTATRDAGILLISIAGNEGFNNDFTRIYPGAYQLENQIVVAASDYNDFLWGQPFFVNSGYGRNSVHLTAPGVFVRTTAARGDCADCSASLSPEDWYALVDGTSASAAFVTGVAALVKSQYPNAHYSVVRRRILESVELRDTLTVFVITGGRLNALGALTIELPITPPVITNLKIKKNGKKVIIDGQKIQRDVVLVVNEVAYPATPLAADFSRLQIKLPKGAIPADTPVELYLRNPDGGESQRTTTLR